MRQFIGGLRQWGKRSSIGLRVGDVEVDYSLIDKERKKGPRLLISLDRLQRRR